MRWFDLYSDEDEVAAVVVMTPAGDEDKLPRRHRPILDLRLHSHILKAVSYIATI